MWQLSGAADTFMRYLNADVMFCELPNVPPAPAQAATLNPALGGHCDYDAYKTVFRGEYIQANPPYVEEHYQHLAVHFQKVKNWAPNARAIFCWMSADSNTWQTALQRLPHWSISTRATFSDASSILEGQPRGSKKPVRVTLYIVSPHPQESDSV